MLFKPNLRFKLLLSKFGTALFLGAILLIVLGPSLLTVLVSVTDNPPQVPPRGTSLRSYFQLFREVDSSMLANTLLLAIPVGIFGAFGGFMCSLMWGSPIRRNALLISSFLIAALPPTVQCVALGHVYRLLGGQEASWLLLFCAHLLWALPFCAITVISAVSQIHESVIRSAFEMAGEKHHVVATRLMLPLVWPAILSAFVVGFLLSFNEYVRTTHLSGSQTYMVEYAYGKMKSGADLSVFALASLGVIPAIFAILILIISLWLVKRKTGE